MRSSFSTLLIVPLLLLLLLAGVQPHAAFSQIGPTLVAIEVTPIDP